MKLAGAIANSIHIRLGSCKYSYTAGKDIRYLLITNRLKELILLILLI